jgi:hypothetical protein
MAKRAGKVIDMNAPVKYGADFGEQPEQNGLAVIQKEFNPRLTQALVYKAKTVEDYNSGGYLLKLFSEATKRAKGEKSKTLEPAELTVKRIKEQWKPFEDGLKAAVEHIKLEMSRFLIEQQQKAEKERNRVLADQRTKPETKEAKLAAVFTPPTDNTRSVLRLEITDEMLIPREFLVVDEVKLKAALREGRKIAGAQLVNDKIIVAR